MSVRDGRRLQLCAVAFHMLKFSNLKMFGELSVSYTHLDVYKRQVLATFSLLRIFLFLSGAMLLGSVITFFCEGLVGLQAQACLLYTSRCV